MDYNRGLREPEQRSRDGYRKRDTRTWLPAAFGQGHEWLQDALAAGAVSAFQWDARSGVSQRSANAAEILGFGPDEIVTSERFLAQIHQDDRKLLKRCVRNIRPSNPAYAISFRFVRPDGRQVWLEEAARAEFDAAGHLLCVSGLTRDITLRRRLDEHQALLLTEFDHRVKNVLSRVAAVVSATRKQAGSVDEYADVVEGRILSLVDAHALMGQRRAVSLPELVKRQLAPYAAAGNSRWTGPDVTLSPEAVEAMAMVLHELVTNAAKYGALSTAGGRVTVQWERAPDGALDINWREVDGPRITHEPHPGYGISLVRNLIPHELAGRVEFKYAPSGVDCTISIPAEHLRSVATEPAPCGNGA